MGTKSSVYVTIIIIIEGLWSRRILIREQGPDSGKRSVPAQNEGQAASFMASIRGSRNLPRCFSKLHIL